VPKSAPKALHLAEGERQQLQQLVNRPSTPQQIALRASIILLADAGRNHQDIGRELGIIAVPAGMKYTRSIPHKRYRCNAVPHSSENRYSRDMART
jgi:hypothetical protein